MAVGYTPKQAERFKRQINMDMARIEDFAYTMRSRISDHNLTVDRPLEELHEVMHELLEIIERRTRA